ncbi:MAG: O-antigen ligase family protein [Aggregatilineales bacterium]
MNDKSSYVPAPTRRTPFTLVLLQHLIILAVCFFVVIGGLNSYLVTVNARRLFAGFIVLACTVILVGRWRNGRLLLSPMDGGWLALVGLTGLSVLTALFPRRSVETWLPTLAFPLPIFYAALYLFRRGWPDRAIFRALLAVGGYLFLTATLLTLAYIAHWLSLKSQGVGAFPFRLWGVLDNPALLGMFIAIAAPCWVGYVPVVRNRVERIAGIVWLLGAALTMVAAATRSATIAALLGSVTALALTLQAHPKQPLARVQRWMGAHKTQARMLAALVILVLIGGLIGLFYVESRAAGHATEADRFDLYRIALQTFTAHPLAGQGPGGFILAELNAHSVPPFTLAPHAHNAVLNFAADSGILGLVGFGALVIFAAWTCITAWRTQPYSRPILAGLIGGLVGFLAAGLLDYPMNQPSLFGLAALLLALIAARTPVLDRLNQMMQIRAAVIVVASIFIACLAVILLGLYMQLWDASDSTQLMAGDTAIDWQAAAERLDTLAQADPSDPLVNAEAAYDWAQAAVLDPSNAAALPLAISRYDRAIPLDPLFSVHRVNLAMLYGQVGKHDRAVQAAQSAVFLATDDPVTWLTLGVQAEAAGQDEQAVMAYQRALTLDPDWSGLGFWQSSADRRSGLNAYTPPGAFVPYLQYNALRLAGDAARTSGQTADAIRNYTMALAAASGNLEQAIAHGLIAFTQGDWRTAQTWLSEAANSGDGTVLNADAWRYLGELAERRGDRSALIAAYAQAFGLLTTHGLTLSYSVNSFWRLGLVSQYLPNVPMLDIDPASIHDFLTLADALQADGDTAGAIQIDQTILRSNPADTATLAAIRRLTF